MDASFATSGGDPCFRRPCTGYRPAMPSLRSAVQWAGRKLVDRRGRKIGTIDAIYVDHRTGRPEYAQVKAGVLGLGRRMVPIRAARSRPGDVMVPYAKEDVVDAPEIAQDEHLTGDQARELHEHYRDPQ
jgi:hypothetical protein